MTELIDWAGYIGAAIAVLCYFLMNAKRISLRVFNWSEFAAAIPLAASTLIHQAYPSLLVTVSYGLIGLYGVITNAEDR